MNKSLAQKVREIGNLGEAWRVICENGRSSLSASTRRAVEEFSKNSEAHLTKIQRQLNQQAFTFSPAIGVRIRKSGKNSFRPLVVSPIESRIVQRAIHNVLLTVPAIARQADNPHSFGGVRKLGSGTQSAVPGAIKAVLASLGSGYSYVIKSDISSFFTKIPKPAVTAIVSSATTEREFLDLFSQAIKVELENLAELRESASEFPIHEIGVAQGNCLSPLLGNLLLGEFDRQMNAGKVRCFRYIDDFLILAPNRRIAESEFLRAEKLLAVFGMQTSEEKTFRGFVKDGFTFLGIELANGAIRPSRQSRARLLNKVSTAFDDGIAALRSYLITGNIERSRSFGKTLIEVSGIVSGWGHHYSFCNERNLTSQLDLLIDRLFRRYLGVCIELARSTDRTGLRKMAGIPLLNELVSNPFAWPSPVSSALAPETPSSVAEPARL